VRFKPAFAERDKKQTMISPMNYEELVFITSYVPHLGFLDVCGRKGGRGVWSNASPLTTILYLS
jgi:hypothetical protein